MKAINRTSGLSRAPNRYEANFDPLIESRGDPAEHGERMPFVIGVLQPADD